MEGEPSNRHEKFKKFCSKQNNCCKTYYNCAIMCIQIIPKERDDVYEVYYYWKEY